METFFRFIKLICLIWLIGYFSNLIFAMYEIKFESFPFFSITSLAPLYQILKIRNKLLFRQIIHYKTLTEKLLHIARITNIITIEHIGEIICFALMPILYDMLTEQLGWSDKQEVSQGCNISETGPPPLELVDDLFSPSSNVLERQIEEKNGSRFVYDSTFGVVLQDIRDSWENEAEKRRCASIRKQRDSTISRVLPPVRFSSPAT